MNDFLFIFWFYEGGAAPKIRYNPAQYVPRGENEPVRRVRRGNRNAGERDQNAAEPAGMGTIKSMGFDQWIDQFLNVFQ